VAIVTAGRDLEEKKEPTRSIPRSTATTNVQSAKQAGCDARLGLVIIKEFVSRPALSDKSRAKHKKAKRGKKIVAPITREFVEISASALATRTYDPLVNGD
jgi:hypothetical protein